MKYHACELLREAHDAIEELRVVVLIEIVIPRLPKIQKAPTTNQGLTETRSSSTLHGAASASNDMEDDMGLSGDVNMAGLPDDESRVADDHSIKTEKISLEDFSPADRRLLYKVWREFFLVDTGTTREQASTADLSWTRDTLPIGELSYGRRETLLELRAALGKHR